MIQAPAQFFITSPGQTLMPEFVTAQRIVDIWS